jgi:hypothetical protein
LNIVTCFFIFVFTGSAKKRKTELPKPVVCCVLCDQEIETNSRVDMVRSCDTCPKWYHIECLPTPFKALVHVVEEWSCPRCVSRVERVCMTCMEVAYTLSNSPLWSTCCSCQCSWHNHCMPEQVRLYAQAATAWRCPKCNDVV